MYFSLVFFGIFFGVCQIIEPQSCNLGQKMFGRCNLDGNMSDIMAISENETFASMLNVYPGDPIQ